MKKSLALGLLCVTPLSFAAPQKVQKQIQPQGKDSKSKISVTVGSTTIYAPDRNTTSESAHGIAITGNYEINLGKNFSTTSSLGIISAGLDRSYKDGTYSSTTDTDVTMIPLIQYANVNAQTRLGKFNAGIGLGLTFLGMDQESSSSDTDGKTSAESEYSTYGETIALNTSFEFKNGITPYVNYTTTSMHSTTARYTGKTDTGRPFSGTYDIDAFSLQTLSFGIGYRF